MNKLVLVNYIKEEDLHQMLRVNTVAPILLVQKLLKNKKINKGCSIVFTASVSGNFTVTPLHALYSVTKGAINSFMKNAAVELGAKCIRCNSVAPGMINTGFLNNGVYNEETIAKDIKHYPLGRYGEPEDVALGIVYLLSDASSWVTGTSLVIDGGLTLY